MYFTDRGIEELADRRGSEEVTFGWLAERLSEFVDLRPDAESTVDRLATWLARLDDDIDDDLDDVVSVGGLSDSLGDGLNDGLHEDGE